MIEFPALNRLPVPLFRSTADGRLAYVNDAWTEEIGAPVGTSWFQTFPEIDEAIAAELWRECVSARSPVSLPSNLMHKEGQPRWYRVLLQPVLVDVVEHMMGSMTDVTDQTVALAESRAILETAVDGIIIIDEQGIIRTFNKAAGELFGYPAEAAVGKSINMLMNASDAARHDGYLQHYLETGEPHIIGVGRELVGRTATGENVPIYLAVSAIELDGERRFAGIVRNLTDQHAAREALASQREKLAHVGRLSTMGEMTASIAHEINQPLTAISMYAQASLKLIDRGDDPRKIKEALEKLATQSLRAGAVIERIQRFARAQETSKEMVDVNHLVADLLNLADSDARLHDIELALDLAEGLPRVFADPVQIQQVVLNLIRNGIDAMIEIGCRNGRSITIRSRLTDHGSIEVLVSDQGPGVADDQMDLLFTPFHTTKKEGMGMGLSICRSIISEHGGVLRHRNNAGPGASFYFTLPVDHD